MSHVSSHTIILRGGGYGGTDPEAGQVHLEIAYTPSPGLTEEQINANIRSLRKLANKAYHIESTPEE